MQSFRASGWKRYELGSAWGRYNDSGNPSSDTASSREPGTFHQTLRHQPKDCRQVAEPQFRAGLASRAKAGPVTVLSAEDEAVVVASHQHEVGIDPVSWTP